MSSPVSPDPDVSTPFLKERIRSLFRQVPKGLAGNEEAIHQMRVAGRRLRVALPLVARKPGGKRVRRALRVLGELTRAAGTSRDLDVISGLLSQELSGSHPPNAEARQLRQRLLSARRRSRVRMAESLLDLEIARLRRDLRAIVKRRGEDLFTGLSRLYRLREEEGDGLLAAIAAVGGRFDPEGLHDLRKRARRLRYAAEVSAALRGSPASVSDIFRELQGQLGTIHDAHVLSGWLGLQAERNERAGQAALAAEARRLADLFVGRSLAAHQALLESGLAETAEGALAAMGRTRSAA